MNLRQFVGETLSEIIQGVKDAQANLGESGRNICPAVLTTGSMGELMKKHLFASNLDLIQEVEFDVAVTVAEGTDTKGGIGVFTGFIGLGQQGASSSASSSLSRIKFTVPISLPTAK